jgi:hypothetical protein
MGRAGTPELRREIALDWAANWRRDHEQTLRMLERAVGIGRLQDAGQYLGQLKALNEKAMSALPRVIERLTDDDVFSIHAPDDEA